VISLGIKPATFWLVAQGLNHATMCSSSSSNNYNYNNKTIIVTTAAGTSAAATTITATYAFTIVVYAALLVGVAVVLLLMFGQWLVLYLHCYISYSKALCGCAQCLKRNFGIIPE
jgi:hypothetical protein